MITPFAFWADWLSMIAAASRQDRQLKRMAAGLPPEPQDLPGPWEEYNRNIHGVWYRRRLPNGDIEHTCGPTEPSKPPEPPEPPEPSMAERIAELEKEVSRLRKRNRKSRQKKTAHPSRGRRA